MLARKLVLLAALAALQCDARSLRQKGGASGALTASKSDDLVAQIKVFRDENCLLRDKSPRFALKGVAWLGRVQTQLECSRAHTHTHTLEDSSHVFFCRQF